MRELLVHRRRQLPPELVLQAGRVDRKLYEIPLAGGTIRDTVQQRQVSAPDRLVTGVSQRGTVTSATGVYAGLVGAPVNGGGAIIVMPDGTLHLNLATAITPLA